MRDFIFFAVLLLIGSYIIGCCKLFKKMGEPVWKFFSPFHVNSILWSKAGINKVSRRIYTVILFAIAAITGLLLLNFIVSFIFLSILFAIALFTFFLIFFNEGFRSMFNAFASMMINPVCFILLFILFVISYPFKAYMFYKLFFKFNKCKKQALLYAIFFPIGVVIVGFDDSEYNNILEKNDDDYLQKMIK